MVGRNLVKMLVEQEAASFIRVSDKVPPVSTVMVQREQKYGGGSVTTYIGICVKFA
jgi:hypothetical protein